MQFVSCHWNDELSLCVCVCVCVCVCILRVYSRREGEI